MYIIAFNSLLITYYDADRCRTRPTLFIGHIKVYCSVIITILQITAIKIHELKLELVSIYPVDTICLSAINIDIFKT